MEIKVVRKTFGEATIGEMFLNDDKTRFCYTLEDKVRADGVKVMNETAIPAGRYKFTVNFSNRFQRDMIQVLDVPMFEGIRIHGGNTKADTSGCILVASKKVNDSTIQGTQEANITAKAKEAIKRKEPCWITITNSK